MDELTTTEKNIKDRIEQQKVFGTVNRSPSLRILLEQMVSEYPAQTKTNLMRAAFTAFIELPEGEKNSYVLGKKVV